MPFDKCRSPVESTEPCRDEVTSQKARSPGDSGKKETRIQTEDQKIVHMALGNMPLKQNFSFENASFKTVLKIIFQIFYLIR